MTKEIKIKGTFISLTRGHHAEVCQWIREQSYLKGSIHETYDFWIQDHPKYYKQLSTCEPLWSVAKMEKKIVAIYFSTILNNQWLEESEAVNPSDSGLYDGFLVIDPSLRGLGLGKKMDEYRMEWTQSLKKWDYNWTASVKDLLEFNIKLGYSHMRPRSSGRYLLWRYADENNPYSQDRIDGTRPFFGGPPFG